MTAQEDRLRDLVGRSTVFAFPEAVRLLALALDAPRPIGTIGPVEEERVLFRSAASLGFPASDIAAITLPEQDDAAWPAQMEVNFLGLYGPASPLPAPWTERIVMDENGAANLRDVLDLFGHPLVGMAYRIWRHYRLHLQFQPAATDPASHAALAMAGLVAGDAWADDALDPLRLLPLCGLLAQHARSAEVIRRVIAGYFDIPVEIEEWVPRMAPIPPDQLFLLGEKQAVLGRSTVLGDSVPDAAGIVTIVLGPLTAAQFDAFLPGGAARRSLAALLRVAVREPVECRIDLILAKDAPGGLTLGSGRLGWTTWQDGADTPRRCPTGPT